MKALGRTVLRISVGKLKAYERAVFVDRDGVPNENRADHVKSWEEFHFLPCALEALALLAPSRFGVFVITNQAIINRGVVPRAAVEEIHYRMVEAIEKAGGRVDEVICCPHTPEENCGCRKPRPGLLRYAAASYGLSLPESYLIGDAVSDVVAGQAAGCRTIMVLTGRGFRQFVSQAAREPKGYRVRWDLRQAVKSILEEAWGADRPFLGEGQSILGEVVD